MVGVPRSKGCAACLQRRVKVGEDDFVSWRHSSKGTHCQSQCDETHPACHACQRRDTQCPGYARERKFYYHRFSEPSPQPRNASQHAVVSLHRGQKQSLDSPIDGKCAPGLVAGAIDQLYREGFCAFVHTSFYGQFHGYRTRVDANWFDVARDSTGRFGHTVGWALRSLGSLQIGRRQGDQRQLAASREMYGQALRQLARLLSKPSSALTDETLMAATLLGVYELVNRTGQQPWLLHSRGISHLFRIRGPQAHIRGLGRTVLVSIRSFLVFEALSRGERCLLGDEEWRSILPDTLKADQQRGRASHLGELIDRAFNEVALVPGFLANVRALADSHTTDGATRQQLVHRIAGCRTTLGDLEMQLSVGTYRPEFVGPISVPVAKLLVQASCEGIELARALLQQLLVVLERDPSRGTAIPAPSDGEDPWDIFQNQTAMMLLARERRSLQPARPQGHQSQAGTWLDRVSMSMGMVLPENAPM
ncbi:hypothetical protein N7510_011766 [Penicillium lagena]|uniref:uncharacterized protein n=1 Tax=Penicillium lagena TaxID=94218 RepID=UPI00253FAA01|nr:uncharacterized protein N7510_011766 [Penicillium lagena]KAJ5602232.1 hypothetical protein N7510_011766 [Penicillium lagena]